MAENERPVLADLKAELNRLEGEVREMASLRWQLARMELESDLRLARRTALTLAAAAGMLAAVLPLGAWCAADALHGRWGIARLGWLAIFAAVLLLGGMLLVALAWRYFRRRFTGLQETFEELHEDAVWLRDWLDRTRTRRDEAGE